MGNFGRNDPNNSAPDLATSQASDEVHSHDDIDSSPRAHHHTIGTGGNNAFAGNRGHSLEIKLQRIKDLWMSGFTQPVAAGSFVTINHPLGANAPGSGAFFPVAVSGNHVFQLSAITATQVTFLVYVADTGVGVTAGTNVSFYVLGVLA